MTEAPATALPRAKPLRAPVPLAGLAWAGLAWGSVAVLAFSVSLPATRVAVAGGLDPWFVGIGRAVVAGLLAAATLRWQRAPWPSPPQLRRLALVALGVVLGFPLLTALALARVPAAHGSVVTGLLPAATAAMAVLRAGERPSRAFWAAALLGLGCVLAFALVQGGGVVGAADLLLLAAVALCALGYAEGGALAREMGGTRVICWALVLSLPATVALTAMHAAAARLAGASGAAWLGFAYVSLVSMFAGFLAWYRGLALGGVARVGQVQLAQPLLSLGWAALLLGERVTPAMLATAVAVVACIVATQRAR